jgi:drug/metabolite transporter (DMT)-like permease
MTMATRYLTAREIGLFTLLETTLGPIWVWLGIGERPTNTALVGELIVITALLANGFLGMRGEKEL